MDKFQITIADIDALNSQDPHMEMINGVRVPKELLYSQRMTDMLQEFFPDASENLKIAVRAQHIQRFTIPREKYPMDRKGYLQWRNELKKFHGEKAAGIMRSNGYKDADIHKVDDLINKRELKTDPDAQTLEDVVCLVFLQFYFDDFVSKHAEKENKIMDIVKKTWRKMSEKGHKYALSLPHSEKALTIINKALSKNE